MLYCNFYTYLSGLKQALIGSGAECETRVDQNGKVGKIGWEPSYRELPEYHAPEDKRMRPLRLRKKIYEFFTAPITKFWADSVSYFLPYFIYLRAQTLHYTNSILVREMFTFLVFTIKLHMSHTVSRF